MGFLAALLMVAASSGTVQSAPDDALLRLKDKVEACVSANATAVEKSEPSLSEAVSFLLGDLCIEQVSNYERYRTNAAFLEQARAKYADKSPSFLEAPAGSELRQEGQAAFDRQRTHFNTAKVDPNSGQVIYTSEGANDEGDPMSLREDVPFEDGGFPASSEFRAFAARAVLDARQSRLAH